MPATRQRMHSGRGRASWDTASSALYSSVQQSHLLIIGAAYTSVSFLKTLSRTIEKQEKWVTIGFIAVSTLIMALAGQPAKLLVLAGALNGLILPVTLGVCLVASQKKKIMGEAYRHPVWLLISGIVVVLLSAYLGITSLANLGQLFA